MKDKSCEKERYGAKMEMKIIKIARKWGVEKKKFFFCVL